MPLPDVGELVEHVEIQNPLLSGLEGPEAGDDVPLVIIDVHVLGDDVDAAVAKDLLPQAVRENRAERRRPIESREHLEDPVLPRLHLAVHSDAGHVRFPSASSNKNLFPRSRRRQELRLANQRSRAFPLLFNHAALTRIFSIACWTARRTSGASRPRKNRSTSFTASGVVNSWAICTSRRIKNPDSA